MLNVAPDFRLLEVLVWCPKADKVGLVLYEDMRFPLLAEK